MSPKRRVQRVAKRRPRPAQTQREPRSLDGAPFDLTRETYLTVRQTMHYLKFTSENAVYHWVRAEKVPTCRRGGSVLFLRRDLDEQVQKSRNQQTVL